MAEPARGIPVPIPPPGPRDVREINVLESTLIGDQKRVFVDPATTRITQPNGSKLDYIRFHNRTEGTIWVWLPNGHRYLKMSENDAVNTIKIEPGRESEQLKVQASPAPGGHYPYHVYCQEIGNGAEGHSEPVVVT